MYKPIEEWYPDIWPKTFEHRFISKENLIILLNTLPNECTIHITPVGEIGVNINDEMIGYIAVGEERYISFSDDKN